jgi:RNA polymerase primary sigma factor
MLKSYSTEFDINAGNYLKDIGVNTPLTKEEEGYLSKQWKEKKDIIARNKLIEANLKFVTNIARNYKGLGLSYSDLIQEGNAGLFKAVDRFDPDKGFKFISYAVNWIRQSILEALNKKNSLKSTELPYETKLTDLDDNLTTDFMLDDVSLDDVYLDLSDDEKRREKDIYDITKFLLTGLTSREKYIVCQYNGIDEKKPKTLEEIGKQLGITKERVRQINEKAMKKLRAYALNNSITDDIYKR